MSRNASAVTTNLLLTGGCFHAFDESAPVLAEQLRSAGVVSEVCTDLEGGLAQLADGDRFELVTVYALRWRMLHPRFDDERDEWAFSLSETGRESVHKHLAGGGGLLALHTAAICFDDWPAWAEIVGAAWNWERSTHPPPRPSQIDVATDTHPIVEGIAGFEVEDEIYSFLDWQPDATPLLTCRYRDVDQPLLAARPCRGGRVVYDALGHDATSLQTPGHATILRRSALWAAGAPDDVVGSTP